MNAIWIKVCGLRRLGEVEACLEAGVDAVGLNFVPTSRRCVGLGPARELVTALGGGAESVGVFVDASRETILETVREVRLDWVQLHGAESDAFARALQDDGLRVLRVVRPEHGARAGALEDRVGERLLIDAPGPEPGGTGRAASQHSARGLARIRPMVLAGGLDPRNVAAAIAAVLPFGVDVASGVEGPDGFKEAARIRRFVTRAREAA